jgi:hypothetical protein
MPDLVTRAWNGTPIARRTTDGYVNATAMCKANGKRWKDYRESDRCQHYLDALESVVGISVYGLVESRSGGAGGGSTWIHPQLAVDLARWISAPFAVWMDGWFLEELERKSLAQDNQPLALSPIETVGTAAKIVCDIHQMIATHTPGLIDARMEIELKRDLLLLKSVAVQSATGMLPGTSSVLSPLDKLPRFMGVVVDPEIPIGVTEFFLQLNDSNLSKLVTNREAELGKRTKAAYRLRYDKDPEYSNGYLSEKRHSRGFPLLFPTKTGKNVPIACYVAYDWDLIVYSAREMGILRPDMAAKLLAECQQFKPSEA